MRAILSKLGRRLSANMIKQSDLHLVDIEGGNQMTQFCAITCYQHSQCLNLYNVDALGGKKLSKSIIIMIIILDIILTTLIIIISSYTL